MMYQMDRFGTKAGNVEANHLHYPSGQVRERTTMISQTIDRPGELTRVQSPPKRPAMLNAKKFLPLQEVMLFGNLTKLREMIMVTFRMTEMITPKS